VIIGKESLDRRFEKMSEIDLKQGMAKAIIHVQTAAKYNCPVHDGELRNSIYTDIQGEGDPVEGICFTNKSHGPYVEFGTGPRGQASHAGISPDVAVAYAQSPWWIHESQIGQGTAETYGWFGIDTPDGRFYQCNGQPAQPFMYPALKDNREEVLNIIAESVRRQL